MYVLTFRLLRIPVTVRPSFLIISALIGMSIAARTRAFSPGVAVIAWVGVVFVSILVHELGHALTARAFGSDVEIELNGVGGLTSWTIPASDFGPGRRATVAAAGSAVGVAFGGVIWLVTLAIGPFDGLNGFIIGNLIFVNVFWGLLNWLPLRPLDGGHLLESLLDKFAPEKGEPIGDVIFFVTAAVALGLSLWFRTWFIALLAGWLLWNEINRRLAPPTNEPPPAFTFDRLPEEEDPVAETDEVDS